jgi:hypothetical protein
MNTETATTTSTLTGPVATLADMFRAADLFTAGDDRPALAAAMIQATAEGVEILATDAYALLQYQIEGVEITGAGFTTPTTEPAKILATISKQRKRTHTVATITTTPETWTIDAAGNTYTGPTTGHQFPTVTAIMDMMNPSNTAPTFEPWSLAPFQMARLAKLAGTKHQETRPITCSAWHSPTKPITYRMNLDHGPAAVLVMPIRTTK